VKGKLNLWTLPENIATRVAEGARRAREHSNR
jgi:hypothetical protein